MPVMALTDSGRGLDDCRPAQPTQIPAIRRAVSEVAQRCGACDSTLTRIELAVTEAATNVVLHAYRTPRDEGLIHYSARLHKDCLDVSVRDDGVGMSPNPASPGLGLGLSLMAHEADSCEIRGTAGGGTEVLMHFGMGTCGPRSPRPAVSALA